MKFNCSVTALNNKNTAAYAIQYKKTADEEYTTEALSDYANQYSVTEAVFIFPAVPSSSYDIVLTATDAFGEMKKATEGKSVFKLWSIFRKTLGIAFGKYAELEGVFDIGFETRFYGGILHPVLEPNTDLNDILTPNTYIGANLARHNYTCGGEALPLTTGTFSLEVVGMGEEGQLKQRLTYCHKTASRAWERLYHADAGGAKSWGVWVCVSDFGGTLLWSGGHFMNAGQTITFSEPVSRQKSGIVFVFSNYNNGAVSSSEWWTYYIPKYLINRHPSGGGFGMGNLGAYGACTKYIYIDDVKAWGHETNEQTVTVGGITCVNTRYVLRYVIGV